MTCVCSPLRQFGERALEGLCTGERKWLWWLRMFVCEWRDGLSERVGSHLLDRAGATWSAARAVLFDAPAARVLVLSPFQGFEEGWGLRSTGSVPPGHFTHGNMILSPRWGFCGAGFDGRPVMIWWCALETR